MTRNKKKKNTHKNKRIFICITIFSFLIIGIYTLSRNNNILDKEKKELKTMFIASQTNEVPVFILEEENTNTEEEPIKKLVENKKIPRGTKVTVTDDYLTNEEKNYSLITIENAKYYIENTNLVSNAHEVVLENKIYVRSATSILDKDNSNKILTLANKGEELEVIDYNELNSDGTVDIYKVKVGETEGFIYGKYISYTKEEADQNYQKEKYDPIHSKIKNTYGGGEAIELDFYPYDKPNFTNNKMPDSVYALYLNCGKNTIDNIDSYIEFAKSTKINAFVVDIKDNETPAYPAKTFETLSPTNYKYAINSYESYKNAIAKLKEAGFYTIGRITTFKDSYYVADHPETAILNKNTNTPYLHNGSYWPSAYSRDVWYYNLSLAIEAVQEFGFNEINFDYVRFPDRMNSVANTIDLKNTYNESKVQTIQRFVQYVTDALHKLNTYVSIDVFGETTNGTYTTAYGQYWPAISNIADVISGMPYPDHFSSGYYGLKKPWNEPYQLMNYWAKYASDRQNETTTPAKVRTWIQAYDVMKYVDPLGITYGSKEVEDEIRGLYDAGLTDGYITWLSNSNLEKYKQQANAFNIDYGKEYSKKNESENNS